MLDKGENIVSIIVKGRHKGDYEIIAKLHRDGMVKDAVMSVTVL